MNFVKWTSPAFAAAAMLCASPLAMAQDRPPLEAYGNLPGVEDAAISPDGTRMAISANLPTGRHIALLNSAAQLEWSIGADGIKFRNLRFVGEDGLLVYRSNTVEADGFAADQYELEQALMFNLAERSAPELVFGGNRQLMNSVFGTYGIRRTGTGWRGFFGAIEYRRTSNSSYVFDHGRPALYAVDLGTMETRQVAGSPNEGLARDWLVDGAGTVVARFDIARSSGSWTIRNQSGEEIASGINNNGDAGLLGLGVGGQSVLHFAEGAEGLTQWFETPLSGGASVPFQADIDIQRLFWSRATGELLGYQVDNADQQLVFYDPAHQRAARMTQAAFPGRNARIVDWTDDLGRFIVHTSGNEDSGTWYLVDIAARRADELGYDRPSIVGAQIGAVSLVSYAAADGLALDGILTLPPGREARDLPLVVLPHGGPHAHDEVAFDWWAQAYASRGYAVFQPNFRGSTGRGEVFSRAGYGEWGRKMQTDISDGVAHLAEQGIVDPARACIVGASYGGYAALAGVTVQQGLYRCAVAVAGVSDISLMYSTERRETGRNGLLVASLQEELGPRERWAEVSPRRLAERADAPILLIHGRDDTVVPFAQSRAMADALDDAGKSHRLVELEGEDHWLSLGETRRAMLREAVSFVETHNPAD